MQQRPVTFFIYLFIRLFSPTYRPRSTCVTAMSHCDVSAQGVGGSDVPPGTPLPPLPRRGEGWMVRLPGAAGNRVARQGIIYGDITTRLLYVGTSEAGCLRFVCSFVCHPGHPSGYAFPSHYCKDLF